MIKSSIHLLLFLSVCRLLVLAIHSEVLHLRTDEYTLVALFFFHVLAILVPLNLFIYYYFFFPLTSSSFTSLIGLFIG
eukprot:gene10857-7523_t